jgi:hypothetical protein
VTDDPDRDHVRVESPTTGEQPRQPEGPALPTLTRHGGGYPPGWLVRYRRRCVTSTGPIWLEAVGVVSGPCLRDVHTNTTWVPLRPRDAAPDMPPQLVRATDFLYAECPQQQ